MVSFFLGLDTSCYTTSLGIVDAKGKPVLDLRKPLVVRAGEKGLRQSEAFFQHMNNLPQFFENKDFCRLIPAIKAVSASEKPRPSGNSYMPVFKAGESVGKVAANSMQAAYYPSTHQEGHILAGIVSAGSMWKNFWAFHLSGGTTELLEVEIRGAVLTVNKIGGGSDIAAGQFVDRIGVIYGLGFPAGPKLEAIARAAKGSCSLPTAVKGNSVSFSGPLTKAERMTGNGPAEVFRAVEKCIASSIIAIIKNASGGSLKKILFVGGVMANKFIKDTIAAALREHELAFADLKYSGDNALGTAEYARRAWLARGDN